MDTTQGNTMAERLAPLMYALSSLCNPDFEDEKEEQKARRFLIEAQLFSIPKLERLLALATKAKEEIFITDIPMLLAEFGLKEGKLPDGTIVTKETIYSTKQIDKEKAAEWLVANGYGSSIKDNIAFERGQLTSEIEEYLEESGASFSHSRDVHPQTLKKVIREHIEAGLPRPDASAIEVTVIERGVVKAPKSKGF